MSSSDSYSSRIGVARPIDPPPHLAEQDQVKPDPKPQSTRDFRKILEKKENKRPESKRPKTASESADKKDEVEQEELSLDTESDAGLDSDSSQEPESQYANALKAQRSQKLMPNSDRKQLADSESLVESDSAAEDEVSTDSSLEEAESSHDTESIFALKQQSKNQRVGRSQKTLQDKPELSQSEGETHGIEEGQFNANVKKSTTVVQTDGRVPVAAEQNVARESPFKVFKKLTSKTEVSSSSKKQGTSFKDDRFQEPAFGSGQQQSVDANYANQNKMAFEPIGSVAQAAPAIKPPSQNLQVLIDQLVKEMKVIERSGKTDTVITLKNVPQFENATMTISASASAPKQFNVQFENLTQTAQRLIEENQAALKTSLKESYDIVLHLITASTYKMEAPVNIVQTETSADRERQGRQEREGQDQQGRNPREQKR